MYIGYQGIVNGRISHGICTGNICEKGDLKICVFRLSTVLQLRQQHPSIFSNQTVIATF